MEKIFFILTVLFPLTDQIKCLITCRTFEISKNESFPNIIPAEWNKCQYDRRAENCYGRIMIYYDRQDYPKLISYSLGPQKHIIEKEIEELINKKRLKFLIYFLFIIESLHTTELIITAYIICQTSDDCALNYIKDFFNFYSNQKNPIDKFSSLYIDIDEITGLICYNYDTKQIEDCLYNQYSTCIFHHDKNLYHQSCHSDPEIKLEYAFMILSSKKTFLEKIYELIKKLKNLYII